MDHEGADRLSVNVIGVQSSSFSRLITLLCNTCGVFGLHDWVRTLPVAGHTCHFIKIARLGISNLKSYMPLRIAFFFTPS
jgi:hypothetical protein